jgi:cystathionine gamma-synthase
MSTITILSKQPPGGRCTLYIRYAEAISRYLEIPSRVKYCEPEGKEADQAPALLIGEILVEPSDGVIVSPEDLIDGLYGRFARDKLNELHQILDAVQEQLMEEWSNE